MVGHTGVRALWHDEFRICTSTPRHVSYVALLTNASGLEVTIGSGDKESSLSGVGLQPYVVNHLSTEQYIAPRNYSAHYRDDKAYLRPGPETLWPTHGAYNNRTCFLLHASCCALLEKYLHPSPIPLARLAELCVSCPVRHGRLLSWGHSHGGLLKLKTPVPWGEREINLGDLDPWTAANGGSFDPCDTPQLGRIMESKRFVKSRQLRLRHGGRTVRNRRQGDDSGSQAKLLPAEEITPNCFTSVPFEVLEYILTFIPTNGVLSLGRSSKGLSAIIPLELGQSFWASRFQVPFECSFAFEALEYAPGELDWKSLYFTVKGIKYPWSKSRRRVWGIVQLLADFLDIKWRGNHTLLPLGNSESELRWEEVHGDLRLPEGDQKATELNITRGCLRLYSQRTAVPTLLSHVAISTFSMEDTTFIMGMRFVSSSGSEVCLGYRGGRESSLETTGIRGLILAVGTRGIHALQLVASTGQVSGWFGNPDGLLKTRRLAIDEPITAIEAGFDVRLTFFIHPHYR